LPGKSDGIAAYQVNGERSPGEGRVCEPIDDFGQQITKYGAQSASSSDDQDSFQNFFHVVYAHVIDIASRKEMLP